MYRERDVYICICIYIYIYIYTLNKSSTVAGEKSRLKQESRLKNSRGSSSDLLRRAALTTSIYIYIYIHTYYVFLVFLVLGILGIFGSCFFGIRKPWVPPGRSIYIYIYICIYILIDIRMPYIYICVYM